MHKKFNIRIIRLPKFPQKNKLDCYKYFTKNIKKFDPYPYI